MTSGTSRKASRGRATRSGGQTAAHIVETHAPRPGLRGEVVLPSLMLVFALVGIGISTYLTIVHYAKAPLVCQKGVFNCTLVTQSKYSLVWHTTIPITVPGLIWFAVSGALAVWAILAFAGRLEAPEWLSLGHLLWGAFGLAFVLWLVYVEFGILKAICEWCSGVHVLTLLTFIVALVRWQRTAAAKYAADAA